MLQLWYAAPLNFRAWTLLCLSSQSSWSCPLGNIVCKQIPWDTNEEYLAAWKEGRTGYPFIDAIMTQLRKEGWIHHLARYFSFLELSGCGSVGTAVASRTSYMRFESYHQQIFYCFNKPFFRTYQVCLLRRTILVFGCLWITRGLRSPCWLWSQFVPSVLYSKQSK